MWHLFPNRGTKYIKSWTFFSAKWERQRPSAQRGEKLRWWDKLNELVPGSIRWVGEWEQLRLVGGHLWVFKARSMLPEHCLDIDDGLGICHVVFLSTHSALLVHNDQVVSIDDTTLQQVVQAVPFRKQQGLIGYDMLENGKYKSNIVNTTPTPKKLESCKI